jgi:hypothetical protein
LRGENITRKEEVISIAVEGRDKPFEIDLSKIDELRKVEKAGAEQPTAKPAAKP